MADYDFSTLNSSDLEELVCDLLNMDQPDDSIIKYKTFKDGKDKGIDFLYSTDIVEFEQVGQVKHYYRTGYGKMLHLLKTEELDKVKKLKPSKYIFATSVDLSVPNTEEIKALFTPFINNLNDIYGKKDLNRLIERHETILNTHYKLWLSDFSILKKILVSDIQFRSSDFVEYELKRRLRIYVKTSLFDNVQEALEKNRFVIITGEPGVGKTTLAEMLVYKYLAEDYQLFYIKDIKEAEKILVPDDSKQIIYFDDFLGSNKVEINKAKGSEVILRSILNRVSKLNNKLVVFTTRSFILNTAIDESENLRKFNIKAKTSLFLLEEYSNLLKKEILRNHIEDSELDSELQEVLFDDTIQEFIITHDNYTPRSIEFITNKDVVNHFNEEEFKEFIFSSFDYPDDIWEHAYLEQITEDDRLLLNTLISFGESASVLDLEYAFNKRIKYEIENNNKQEKMYAFKRAMKRLEGGFVLLKNEDIIHFINPSLIDFLVKYISQDKNEILKIINSAKYVSQLTGRVFSLSREEEIKIPKELEYRLLKDYQSFVSNGDFDRIQLALLIYNYVDSTDKDDIVCDIIDSITDWEALHEDYSLNMHFNKFMLSVENNSKIYSFLQERIEEIVSDIFKGNSDINDAIDLLEELTHSFNIDYSEINTINIIDHLDDLFSEHIANEVQWLLDWMTYEDEAQEKLNEIEELVERINSLGLKYKADTEEFGIDWYDVAMHNEMVRLMAEED